MIEMGNGGSHFVLDDIGLQPQLVTAVTLIVFLRPHIVSKLGYVLSAATMVTAIARSPVFIPPKNRAEIVSVLRRFKPSCRRTSDCVLHPSRDAALCRLPACILR